MFELEDEKDEQAGEEGSAPGTADGDEEGQSAGGDAPEGGQASHEPLTQERVNEIVRERLAKRDQQLFARLGVSDESGIDELAERARGYGEKSRELEEALAENRSLKESIAIRNSGIVPEREDDVRTYFKGKGLEMSEEAIKQAIGTHPEWAGATPAQAQASKPVQIGAEPQAKQRPDLEGQAARLFGLDRFV